MHKLTEKLLALHKYPSNFSNDFDSIITSWLREKADEVGQSHVYKILGLSEVETSQKYEEWASPNEEGTKRVEDSKVNEWCSHCVKDKKYGWVHMPYYSYGELSTWLYLKDEWDICPMKGCHAPRPTPISLEQKLAEKLHNFYWSMPNDILKDHQRRAWKDIATLALEFAREHKEELG